MKITELLNEASSTVPPESFQVLKDVYGIEDIKWNSAAATVDSTSSVDLTQWAESFPPPQFGVVNGDFNASPNVEDLSYLPLVVKGVLTNGVVAQQYFNDDEESDFEVDVIPVDLASCKTKSAGEFDISLTNITSLNGMPSTTICTLRNNDQLTSLRGLPSIVRQLLLKHCLNLADISAATNVRELWIENCPKIQIEHIPDVTKLTIEGVSSLAGIHKKRKVWNIKTIRFVKEPPTNMLGLLLVKGLESVVTTEDPRLGQILTRHIQGDRDINECQEELIDAGFKAQAKL